MPKKIFTSEMERFIQENYIGLQVPELTKLLNEAFGTEFKDSQVNAYKSRKHLKSGAPSGKRIGSSKVYPKEVWEFIHENHKGVGPYGMVALVKEKFGITYTKNQMKGFYSRCRLNSGLTGRYEKGNIPYNKGKKGYCAPGSEKGWFSKDRMPPNHKPVGSTRVNVDGYLEVKVEEPKKWRLAHHVVYEENFGAIPKSYIVTFRDGNKQNLDPGNLMLIPRKIHSVMNKCGLNGYVGDAKETAVNIASMKIAIREAKRRKRKG